LLKITQSIIFVFSLLFVCSFFLELSKVSYAVLLSMFGAHCLLRQELSQFNTLVVCCQDKI